MTRIAIIDFETTGMSPDAGDRATEVAVVLMEHGQVVDRYQSLMNAGVRIPPFITRLTGITDAMVAGAPPAAAVMREAARFVGEGTPMVAHNAAFDRRFWVAELARAGLSGTPPHPFACTVRLARRLYPELPSHRLGALVDHFQLPRTGRAHRALADAEMAAALLDRIQHDLRVRHAVGEPDHAFLVALQCCTRAALPAFMVRAARPTAMAA